MRRIWKWSRLGGLDARRRANARERAQEGDWAGAEAARSWRRRKLHFRVYQQQEEGGSEERSADGQENRQQQHSEEPAHEYFPMVLHATYEMSCQDERPSV